MTSKDNYSPVVLCILDGWGIGDPKDNQYNAIFQAETPIWSFCLKNFPHTELVTSEKLWVCLKGKWATLKLAIWPLVVAGLFSKI